MSEIGRFSFDESIPHCDNPTKLLLLHCSLLVFRHGGLDFRQAGFDLQAGLSLFPAGRNIIKVALSAGA